MTDFLYARPSVLEGIGRNIDFFGSMNTYNYSSDGDIADKIALTSDIFEIYKDFYTAFYQTICQQEKRKTDAV
jgi:hypothetical protein